MTKANQTQTETWEGWHEAFRIFARYAADPGILIADHDGLYARIDPDTVSEPDKQRLAELGWNPDEAWIDDEEYKGSFYKWVS